MSYFFLAAFPVPDSGTLCGELIALPKIIRLPLCGVAAGGVKVTDTLQLLPGSSVAVALRRHREHWRSEGIIAVDLHRNPRMFLAALAIGHFHRFRFARIPLSVFENSSDVGADLELHRAGRRRGSRRWQLRWELPPSRWLSELPWESQFGGSPQWPWSRSPLALRSSSPSLLRWRSRVAVTVGVACLRRRRCRRHHVRGGRLDGDELRLTQFCERTADGGGGRHVQQPGAASQRRIDKHAAGSADTGLPRSATSMLALESNVMPYGLDQAGVAPADGGDGRHADEPARRCDSAKRRIDKHAGRALVRHIDVAAGIQRDAVRVAQAGVATTDGGDGGDIAGAPGRIDIHALGAIAGSSPSSAT